MRDAFEETIQNFKRNLSLSISSFIVIQVIILVFSVFFTSGRVIANTISSIRSDTQIHVQIDDELNGEQIDKLVTDIKNKYNEVQIEYSSKEKELKKMMDYYGDSGSFLEIYKEDNPLKNALLLRVNDLEKIPDITKELNKMEGVFNASYGGGDVLKITNTLQDMMKVIYIVSVGLAGLIILILYNIVKLTILSRKEDIFIKNSIGVSPFMIKLPFMMESVMFHLVSCIIPVASISLFYTAFYRGYQESAIFGLKLIEPFTLFWQLSLFLFIFSFVIGTFSSYIASRGQIKKVIRNEF